MRLFLAIDLPERIKKSLNSQLENLKLEYPQFNWVGKDNYHITLYFFGNTDKTEKIIKKLKDILYDQESFYLYSTDTDLFMRNQIVIYLNFRRERKLEQLAKKVKESFSQEYVTQNKFVPHLSLARCRIPSKQQYFVLKKRLARMNIDIDFPVNKIILFQSLLGRRKPVYKKIEEFPLI